MSNTFWFYTCLFFWISGVFLASNLTYIIPIADQAVNSVYESMSFWEVFCYLFKTNITVGLLCCYMGYATAGLMTVFILMFNGYLFGMALFVIAKLQHHEVLEFGLLIKLFGHVPLEIISFCLFGMYGLSGFNFVLNSNSNSNKEILSDLPSIKSILFPFVLLVIAAIIESYSIKSF
ncbi:stage II sporulation protein M [Aquirufa regiilacus]